MDLNLLLKEVSGIAKETGQYIHQRRRELRESDIHEKGIHDYVTMVDKESEIRLVKELLRLLPGSGFITEEKTTKQEQKEYTWIIDPLDGTTNFMHNTPPYAVSIALHQGRRTILGVIYEITLDEMFVATMQDPAQKNGEEIRVTHTPTLDGALIATGFPFINFDRLEPYMQVLKTYMANTQGVRRLGSAATDLAYVACGRYDGFYEYNLNPWDVAAGAFIVERAGGKVSDFSGKDNYIFGKEIVATNGSLHEDFMIPIKQFLV
ncbi:MAG: inositol monophosphatase [Chlorobi bacterium]|nr:inositol monophosphatase [Chlorobiota bacterium]